MKGIAFVNQTDASIYSLFVSPSTSSWMPAEQTRMNSLVQEPETPEGTIRVVIPDTITHLDAIKAIREEDGTVVIVDDEDKLAYLRALALPHIRKTRNELIAMCDYTMFPDVSLTEDQKQAWVAYRKALREITDQDPLFVQWPKRPDL